MADRIGECHAHLDHLAQRDADEGGSYFLSFKAFNFLKNAIIIFDNLGIRIFFFLVENCHSP